jgi:hypothetical protein
MSITMLYQMIVWDLQRIYADVDIDRQRSIVRLRQRRDDYVKELRQLLGGHMATYNNIVCVWNICTIYSYPPRYCVLYAICCTCLVVILYRVKMILPHW